MLGEDYQLIIGDFGLSTDMDWTSTICGTELFKAPEIFTMSKDEGTKIDPKKIDLFAAGIILFQWIVGHHPFQNKGAHENPTYNLLQESPEKFWE